jgi:CDP-diacylglycerol--glycerol-3-phosphate 3-phosphatidyltransferase
VRNASLATETLARRPVEERLPGPVAEAARAASEVESVLRQRYEQRSERWNIPNALTVLRLLLIPAILFVFEGRFVAHELLAPGLFVLAAGTDFLDGRIARRSGRVTELGKFLDPLADKLLILSVLFVMVQDHMLLAWVAVIIVGRELLITGVRSIAAAQHLIIAATPWGKTKTVSQMLAVTLLMLSRPYPSVTLAASVLVVIAVAFTLLSGGDYLVRYRRVLYH